MTKQLAVLDANKKKCLGLCDLLKYENYSAAPLHSVNCLEKHLLEIPCNAVLIDIDTVTVDNLAIRDLARKNPGVFFMCLSKDWFHPGLKDAISKHIYASIKKPVDLEELLFLINSIYDDNI
jgi:DNA-binding NtrC family response regulator